MLENCMELWNQHLEAGDSGLSFIVPFLQNSKITIWRVKSHRFFATRLGGGLWWERPDDIWGLIRRLLSHLHAWGMNPWHVVQFRHFLWVRSQQKREENPDTMVKPHTLPTWPLPLTPMPLYMVSIYIY